MLKYMLMMTAFAPIIAAMILPFIMWLDGYPPLVIGSTCTLPFVAMGLSTKVWRDMRHQGMLDE